ncbi:MAG: polysaccharide export protein [Gemmatimonadetes bacterium]|nr:polysaccharide export protein [Gemmatimonadota bacterium]
MRFTSSLAALVLCAASLPAQQPAPSAVMPGSGGYTIRPGDILKVDVWGHTEYSGQFMVDESGHLQYPVIGDIQVQNLSLRELRERLRQGLEQLFRSPFLTVTPLFRMAVLGQVRSPGLYTVDPTLSVLDVVAMAGGPVPGANTNRIRLLRAGSEVQLSLDRGRSLQDIGVRSGDQVLVPRKGFTREDVTLLLAATQLALTIAIFVKQVQQ